MTGAHTTLGCVEAGKYANRRHCSVRTLRIQFIYKVHYAQKLPPVVLYTRTDVKMRPPECLPYVYMK